MVAASKLRGQTPAAIGRSAVDIDAQRFNLSSRAALLCSLNHAAAQTDICVVNHRRLAWRDSPLRAEEIQV